ncbi:MAG TPA: hypothetical protein VGG74_08825 [Kofleriaceae bacterium]|jgi:hypothetical protein
MPESRDDDDNDLLAGPVPAPDDEPSAAERAHAKAFAELVDKTLAGRTPPAMNTDDRALLEVATVIRAASGNVELAQPRRRALIEDALRQAVGARSFGTSGTMNTMVTAIRSTNFRRWAPWSVAGASMLVAAAAVVLWLRAPHREPTAPPVAARQLPENERMRPADPLVGPIAREHAGDTASRIDAIFADRLDGYRELRFGRAP